MRISNYLFFCTLFCVCLVNGQINTYSPYSYFGVGELEVSWNDKFLGYSLDLKGSELINILNIET